MADLSFKNCNLGPKTAIFGPKRPWNIFKTAKRRETVGTPHVRLDFSVSTSSLWPSNSMICPGKGPKKPPKAPNADSHKPRIGHIFGYMAQSSIPRAAEPGVCYMCDEPIPRKRDTIALKPVSCDACRATYHLRCAKLAQVPRHGSWICESCALMPQRFLFLHDVDSQDSQC